MTEQNVDLNRVTPTQQALDMVPGATAHMHIVLPLRVVGHRLEVAVTELTTPTLDNLRYILNYDVVGFVAPESDILDGIARHYGESKVCIGAICQQCGHEICQCADNARIATEKSAEAARASKPKPVIKSCPKSSQDVIKQNYQVCFECGAIPLERVSDGAWANYCHRCGKAMPAYLLMLAQGQLGVECFWCGKMVTQNKDQVDERALLLAHAKVCPEYPLPCAEDFAAGPFADGAPPNDNNEAEYILLDRWGCMFIGHYKACSLADCLSKGFWSCGAGSIRVEIEDIAKHALVNPARPQEEKDGE